MPDGSADGAALGRGTVRAVKPNWASWKRLHDNGVATEVIHASCDDVHLEPASIDMILTGPPGWPATHVVGGGYEGSTLGSERSAADYAARLATMLSSFRAALRPTGTCWIVTEDAAIAGALVSVSSLLIQAFCAGGWRLRGEVIIAEPFDSYTPIRKVLIFGERPGVVREVWPGPSHRKGTAQFYEFDPFFVMRCAGFATLPGQTICDPFCGSGTAGVVAQRIGRNFVGIESGPNVRAAVQALQG